MQYRQFGRTGWNVSDIGYGLWGMGGWSGSDDQQSAASLQFAADAGCTLFDSAWGYGEGKSDQLLGQLLARNRGKRLYAASKVPPMNLKWPAQPSYSYDEVFPPEHVFKYADVIRKNLATDAIDLLQFHVWHDGWADEPDFRNTVEKLKRDGIIRAFGLSLNRWEPENGIRAIRTGLVDAVQVIYNIFDQAPEDELFPLCREMNVGVIARVPLDEGSLGGKMTLETRFPEGDWRARYFTLENLKPTIEREEQLKKVVPEGITLPELALRFVLSNPTVSTTIVGMRSPEHVRANIGYSDKVPLPADLIGELRQHLGPQTDTLVRLTQARAPGHTRTRPHLTPFGVVGAAFRHRVAHLRPRLSSNRSHTTVGVGGRICMVIRQQNLCTQRSCACTNVALCFSFCRWRSLPVSARRNQHCSIFLAKARTPKLVKP
jgi:aryl-alcohol dehydrogenase-like predicted oxidoreductase